MKRIWQRQSWEDRPEFPAGKVMVLKEEITGKSFEKKREEVMEKVREEGCTVASADKAG